MPEGQTNVTQSDAPASGDIKVVTELKRRLDALEQENNQLKADKSELLNNFINDQPPAQKEVTEPPVNEPKVHKTEEQLAKEFNDLVKSNPSNLEYAKKAIEMDNWYIENKGESIFLPKGHEVIVTENERATAERVHTALKDCIEQSNDDPRVFNAVLSKICPGRFPEKKLPNK